MKKMTIEKIITDIHKHCSYQAIKAGIFDFAIPSIKLDDVMAVWPDEEASRKEVLNRIASEFSSLRAKGNGEYEVLGWDSSFIGVQKTQIYCGEAIYDGEYNPAYMYLGNKITCTYFTKWSSMVSKCFGPDRNARMCPEWRVFTVFRQWCINNKRISSGRLMAEARFYSPYYCWFKPSRAQGRNLRVRILSMQAKVKATKNANECPF